jgi:hypothetical protein
VWEQENCLPELDDYIVYESPKSKGILNIWISITGCVNQSPDGQSKASSTPANVAVSIFLM